MSYVVTKLNLSHLAAGVALAVLASSAGGAYAHPPADHDPPPPSTTRSLQGDDAQAWIDDPHIHAFYAAAVAATAQGAARADIPAFEKTSFAIFRDFGASRGMKPEAMQDHLKLIPRQVIQIAKEDPHALDTYESFVEAMFGPK